MGVYFMEVYYFQPKKNGLGNDAIGDAVGDYFDNAVDDIFGSVFGSAQVE